MATKKWMNEVQQITLILSTMASRMFMAGDLMEVLLNLVDIKI
ncbi:putative adhesin-like autotransporter [Escherichia coli 1-110-08_S3_C1]|nr:putative adhesin-like autotransporter [Escherichia coli 1-110-08_S3_C1]